MIIKCNYHEKWLQQRCRW